MQYPLTEGLLVGLYMCAFVSSGFVDRQVYVDIMSL